MHTYKYPKFLLLFSGIVLALSLLAGGTLAYFTDTAQPLVNTFLPSRVTTDVEEQLDGSVKSNVVLQNTGSASAYLRASISITWKDENGKVYGEAPVLGKDYSLDLDLDQGWVLSADGFYYWVMPVLPAESHPDNCSTGVLISTCSPLGDGAPEGYALNVEIIGSGIQSMPAYVVADHWGSGVLGVKEDGSLQIRTGGSL